MKKNLTRQYWLFVIIAFLSVQFSFAQLKLTDTLPIDSKVKIGKLENGLTYYIRQNKKPEQKVELRLVVNTGSIMEDDDQLGLAHMAEHMAFNGTKNFKKNDIVSFLQEIGVGFGNDLNAYTSFDETVYILPIPTDKPDNLEKGFQVLEDWAHNVTYLNEDIDGERPIILEESRLGKGAGERMLRQYLPKIFEGSKYADRLPIGKDSIIKNFPYDAIKRFYRDWYRPNLMAVVVVGDIEPAVAEQMIRKHFASLVNPKNERPRMYTEVPPYKEPMAMVVTDKEATSYNVNIIYPATKKDKNVVLGDYRKMLVRNMFTAMFNNRLQELTQKENPPFNYAFTDFDSYARGYEAFGLNAGAGTGDVTKAMNVLLEELEKVKRYGFLSSELERAKKTILASYEKMFNNRDKTESENFVEEYVRNFLNGESIPGMEKEFEYAKAFVPDIKLEEVNAVVNSIKDVKNKFALIFGPEAKENAKLPEKNELLNLMVTAEKKEVKPYEEKAVAAALMTTKPAAGKIISKTINDKLGITELKLSNGITVTLKPTDFKNDEILLSGVRPGGTGAYSLADKYNAQYATQVVSAMGIGNFSPTDLKKANAGKIASVSLSIGETSDEIRGNSSVKDLETMFQLLYLNVTAPRKDTALFNSFIKRNKSQFAAISSNPQAKFIDTMISVLYNQNPLAPSFVPKSEYFDKINVNRATEIYKEHFGDLNGMNLVIVGSIKEEVIVPLIETYIASLPATQKKFTYTDNKVRPVKGKQNFNYNRGKEDKSLILQFFTGEVPYSEDLELKARAITEVLNIRIIEELREKIGGIYGGGIFGGLERNPYPHFQFVAQLPCGPEKAQELLAGLNKLIDSIVRFGPSEKNLEKVKQQWREEHKKNMKENNSWLEAIKDSKFPGNDISYFTDFESYIDKLTTKDIKQAASIVLNGKNSFTATLMPENYTPGDIKKTGNRENNIIQTIELTAVDFKVELFDNGQIDGDSITVYFNGQPVVSKQKLTEKSIIVNLKAKANYNNTLVMYAENLGSIPPNTAVMKVTAGAKTFTVNLESDTKKNGTVVFKLKK